MNLSKSEENGRPYRKKNEQHLGKEEILSKIMHYPKLVLSEHRNICVIKHYPIRYN